MGYYLKQMTGLSVVMGCTSYLLAAQIWSPGIALIIELCCTCYLQIWFSLISSWRASIARPLRYSFCPCAGRPPILLQVAVKAPQGYSYWRSFTRILSQRWSNRARIWWWAAQCPFGICIYASWWLRADRLPSLSISCIFRSRNPLHRTQL